MAGAELTQLYPPGCPCPPWRPRELGASFVSLAEAMAVNQASRRVMEKAGLKLMRTFHQPWPYPIDGDQFGGVEYALDNADWQQQEIAAGDCPPA